MGNYDVPMITKNQSQVVGTIVFNYAFVTSVPSWVNEKKKGVGINKTVSPSFKLMILSLNPFRFGALTCFPQFSFWRWDGWERNHLISVTTELLPVFLEAL